MEIFRVILGIVFVICLVNGLMGIIFKSIYTLHLDQLRMTGIRAQILGSFLVLASILLYIGIDELSRLYFLWFFLGIYHLTNGLMALVSKQMLSRNEPLEPISAKWFGVAGIMVGMLWMLLGYNWFRLA